MPRLPIAVILALSFLALTTTAVSPSMAQQEPVCPEVQRARDLYDRGADLYRKKQYGEALPLFEAVWSLCGRWEAATQMGACELELGRYRQAAEHLALAKRSLTREAQASDVAFIEEHHALAMAKVATVRLRGLEPGWRVLADGRLIGDAPLLEPVFLEPGSHTLVAEGPKQARVERSLNLQAGATTDVDFAVARPLAPSSAAPPPASAPSASATSGMVAFPPPRSARDEQAGPGWGGRTWVGLAGGTLALAAVGVGVGMALRAHALDDDASAMADRLRAGAPERCELPSPQCSDLERKLNDRKTSTNWAVASLAAGGVIGVATVAAVLWWPKPGAAKAQSRYWVVPGGAGTMGLTVGGAF